MLHALLHNNKLIGLFSNYKKCITMMNGLISNKFVLEKNIMIKSYVENSITEGEYIVDDVSESDFIMEEISSVCTTESDEDTNDMHKKESVKESLPKVKLNDEQIKEKCELQNSINDLKKKKEKLEESKRVFDVDLSLYNKFKELKNANINFNIPDMFIEKYKLMSELEKENKLNWFNFNELYKAPPIITSFSKVFENEHNMTVPY
jgi:hypothetical protein